MNWHLFIVIWLIVLLAIMEMFCIGALNSIRYREDGTWDDVDQGILAVALGFALAIVWLIILVNRG